MSTYSFEEISAYNSNYSPTSVHVKNSAVYRFFQRYLLRKAMSAFKFYLPENWAENYFKYALFCNGTVCVLKTAKFGTFPQMCGLFGYNVMYQPTKAIVTNPLLKTRELVIGVDTELIRMNEDYRGIMDCVNFYSELLSLAAEAAGMNLVDSKTSVVFAASNRAMAESFKKAMDKVQSGEPMVVIDKSLTREDGKMPVEMFLPEVGKNYILDRLLVDMRKIVNMFCTDIGIANANTEKRERLLVDEVNANNEEVRSVSDMWVEQIRKGCEKVNDMFYDGERAVWVERRGKNDSIYRDASESR